MTIPVPVTTYQENDDLSIVVLEAASAVEGGAICSQACVAVGVWFSGLTGRNLRESEATLIPWEWGLIRELAVNGSPRGEALISLTATAAQDGEKFYAVNAYARQDDTLTRRRLIVISVDAETDRGALTYGRRNIVERLSLGEMRIYRTTDIPSTIPTIGQTVRIQDDGFEGVMVVKPGLQCSQGGPLELTLTLCDMRRAL